MTQDAPLRRLRATEAELFTRREGMAEPAEAAGEPDDSDMVVIEEDLVDHPSDIHKKSIFTVRPGDYRSLFARLRRGDR